MLSFDGLEDLLVLLAFDWLNARLVALLEEIGI